MSWVTDGDRQWLLQPANGYDMPEGEYQRRYPFGHSTVILCINNIPVMNLGQGATMVGAELKKLIKKYPGPYMGNPREVAAHLNIEGGYSQSQILTHRELPGSIAFISNESLLHHYYTGRAKVKKAVGDKRRVDDFGTVARHVHKYNAPGNYTKSVQRQWQDYSDTPPQAKMALSEAYNELHSGPVYIMPKGELNFRIDGEPSGPEDLPKNHLFFREARRNGLVYDVSEGQFNAAMVNGLSMLIYSNLEKDAYVNHIWKASMLPSSYSTALRQPSKFGGFVWGSDKVCHGFASAICMGAGVCDPRIQAYMRPNWARMDGGQSLKMLYSFEPESASGHSNHKAQFCFAVDCHNSGDMNYVIRVVYHKNKQSMFDDGGNELFSITIPLKLNEQIKSGFLMYQGNGEHEDMREHIRKLTATGMAYLVTKYLGAHLGSDELGQNLVPFQRSTCGFARMVSHNAFSQGYSLKIAVGSDSNLKAAPGNGLPDGDTLNSFFTLYHNGMAECAAESAAFSKYLTKRVITDYIWGAKRPVEVEKNFRDIIGRLPDGYSEFSKESLAGTVLEINFFRLLVCLKLFTMREKQSSWILWESVNYRFATDFLNEQRDNLIKSVKSMLKNWGDVYQVIMDPVPCILSELVRINRENGSLYMPTLSKHVDMRSMAFAQSMIARLLTNHTYYQCTDLTASAYVIYSEYCWMQHVLLSTEGGEVSGVNYVNFMNFLIHAPGDITKEKVVLAWAKMPEPIRKRFYALLKSKTAAVPQAQKSVS
ncbi:MAG: hypothetical protein GY718_19410 [Lentisphaerae bacterium]|nr:hypothetical protein [Lentisphaerota bacterium]